MATILRLAFTAIFTCYFVVDAVICDPGGQCLSGLQDETSLLQQSLLTSLGSRRHVSAVDHSSTENENEDGVSVGRVTACATGQTEFTPVKLTGSGDNLHGRIDKSGASICGVKGELVGSGSNGDVYLGHPATAPSKLLAMKFPHNKQLPKDAKDAEKVQHEFDNEVEVLVHLRKVPQHIVMLIGFNPQERALAMEAMLGGDLSKQKGPLALPHVKTLVENVLKGVADCHEHHVAHRDIKEEQFSFVRKLDDTATSSKDWSTPLKLLDFGEAIQFKNPMGFRKSSIKAWTAEELKGTPTYVSPEWAFNMLNVGKEKKFSAYAPDIWAVGVIAYQLATGKEFTAELFKQVESHKPERKRKTWPTGKYNFWRRIAEATDADIQNVVLNGFAHTGASRYANDVDDATLASNFVKRCLKKDLSQRMVTGSGKMTAAELLKDLWFST